MGPGGHLCRFDNAPQDGDSAGTAEAAHCHRLAAPNTGPRYPPSLLFAISNPAMEEVDPGRSISETASKKKESVVAPSAHASKQWRNGGRKVKGCLPQSSPPLFRHRPGGDPEQGGGVSVGPIWHPCIAIRLAFIDYVCML